MITFGSYEKDNNTANGKEPIEWIVLDVQDGKSLLISRYALDCKPYHSYNTSVTWENCSLRKWLNNEFMSEAFSAEEKARIPALMVSADKNPEHNTNPGYVTQDQIFLLSIPETNEYFASDAQRQCKASAYAIAQGCYVNQDENCWWWLRTPGSSSAYAAGVGRGGTVSNNGNSVNGTSDAVRPAMWVSLK